MTTYVMDISTDAILAELEKRMGPGTDTPPEWIPPDSGDPPRVKFGPSVSDTILSYAYTPSGGGHLNGETLGQFYQTDSGNNSGLSLRGGVDAEGALFASYRSLKDGEGSFALRAWKNGAYVNLANKSYASPEEGSVPNFTPFWIRMRVEATGVIDSGTGNEISTLQARLWIDGDPEPVAWTLETTTSISPLAGDFGFVGSGSNDSGALISGQLVSPLFVPVPTTPINLSDAPLSSTSSRLLWERG